MNNKEIIFQTEQFIKNKLQGEGSGHDWWHVYRVWKNAVHLGAIEGADLFAVELAALLHDIADWKFNDGDEEEGPNQAGIWLRSIGVDEPTVGHVCSIIRGLSFKGANVESNMATLEGRIVQDADRLDAIGAIGIARTFAYGGYKGREIYNPSIKPVRHNSFEEYKSNTAPTLNHFYEKLLLLKDLMNTETAKKLAEGRNKFMEEFLDKFYKEWEGIE